VRYNTVYSLRGFVLLRGRAADAPWIDFSSALSMCSRFASKIAFALLKGISRLT
jgi:hypothetical protein